MGFDITAVRSGYPALAEGYAHFDGAAGTLVAEPVAAAATAVLRAAVANRTNAFEPGRRAVRILDEARAAVADLLGAEPGGVVFGPSATALTYTVSRTLAKTWRPGDEIVVSRLDHDANVRPWEQAATAAGATVRWAEVDIAAGALPTAQYADLIGERTRLVAVTAASNVAGSCPDVPAIAALAHAAGALCYVDGVHATPHVPVDVTALGADFYVTSAYKWSGPHLAACAAAPRQWAAMSPDKLVPSPDVGPERFEFGTPSFELLAGVTAAVDHLASLGGEDVSAGSRRDRVLRSMAAVEEYESDLFATLLDGLADVPGIWLCPSTERRCPTLAFRLGDTDPAVTASALGDERICVFAGDYYAAEYFTALGLRATGGAVRASVYHYTSVDDVTRLIDAVRGLSRLSLAG